MTREVKGRRREARGRGVTRTGASLMDDGLLVLALRARVTGEDRVHAELQHRLEGGELCDRGGDRGGALAGGGGGRGGLEGLLADLRSLLGLPGQLQQLGRGGGVVKTGPEEGGRGWGAQTRRGGGVARGRGSQVTEILGKHPQTQKTRRSIKLLFIRLLLCALILLFR